MNVSIKQICYSSILGLLASSTAYADIGTLHKEEHKRRPTQPPLSEQATPLKSFNLFDMKPMLDLHYQGEIEKTLGGHVDQLELESLPAAQAFAKAFEEGDELFEIKYNVLDGVGINVGNGNRFTSIPRLDLNSWANVLPHRITGPNGDLIFPRNSGHLEKREQIISNEVPYENNPNPAYAGI